MPEDENKNIKINECDYENLKLIFSTSNDIKKEVSKALTDNSDLILKILNFLLLLAGIYTTLLLFVCDPLQNKSLPILWPAILSGLFLSIALILSIIELFPSPSLPMILPREMYKLISKKHSESLQKITATYLKSVNKMWIKAEEKSFSRQKIILFTFISVTNFLLFIIYCIYNSYKMYLDILAINFSIGFLIYYLYFTKKRRNEINQLKEKLEKD